MSPLAVRQAEMMASLLDDERALPAGWSERHASGLDIYRNNYRTALVVALRATFERTERLVGKDSFARAAAHHLITHPPSSWTLDLAGEGFAETCAELFANDPEVGELAWLEWAMHTAFVTRDCLPLAPADFMQAAQGFGEDDWTNLRFKFAPAVTVRTVDHDLKLLWNSLAEDGEAAQIGPVTAPAAAIVWREGERPVFLLVPQAEGEALAAMIAGVSYGEACDAMVARCGEEAIEMAGTMLRRWLGEGMVERIVQ